MVVEDYLDAVPTLRARAIFFILRCRSLISCSSFTMRSSTVIGRRAIAGFDLDATLWFLVMPSFIRGRRLSRISPMEHGLASDGVCGFIRPLD